MRAIFVEKKADSYSVSKNDHCHEVGRCNKDIFSPIINLLPNIFSSVYHILTENKIGQTKWSLIARYQKNTAENTAAIAENMAVVAHNTAVTALYAKKNAELTNALGFMVALK